MTQSSETHHSAKPLSSPASPASAACFAPPGVPQIHAVNWAGLRALYVKEVRRFIKVQLQTIWAPAITTLLFLVIFNVALGRSGRTILDVPFADFLAPGLIAMAMMQNSFANSSFSLLVGKIQGTITDFLLPPLSEGELMAALVGAAVTRAICVGCTIWLAMVLWPGVSVTPQHFWAVVVYGILGAMMLGSMGVITSIWAEKFDHAAAITNFVIAPLSLLSGTFYTIDRLSPTFQLISQINPFYHMIMGFRYGFIGAVDASTPHPLLLSLGILVILNILLIGLTYSLLKSGWKLKA